MHGTLYLDVQTVADRLGLDTGLDGVQTRIESAILGAQKAVESVLDSKFVKQSWTATYFLDSTAYSSIQPNGLYRLELPSGFVRASPALVIYYAGDWNMSTQILLTDTTLYSLDLQRGVLSLDSTAFKDLYVKVTGESGFTVGTPNTDPAVQPEAIPDYLTEALVSHVGVVLDVTAPTNRARESEGVYQRAVEHALDVLAPYLRKRGFMIRPVA